ncbi:class V chitinase [Pochonia chlamydosporia 170]|uniref:chitinase n=1 Tax=Pochonia chlamydosporia 170 TaxID=1380566 RepID=A0A179F8L3_METCM|nr:class V chitinase [Pochonia chlamydosporia 170]OAQ61835.1 class V chitinase [Pochonia chlamydosporia 170]
MSYDLYGKWDPSTDYGKEHGAFLNAHTNLTEIRDMLDLLWRNDINPQMVTLGFAFYGRSATAASPGCVNPGCQFVSAGLSGLCSNEAGVLLNTEIDQIIKENSLTPNFDKEAAIKWISWGGNQWVSYDDADTFKIKADFAKSFCLGGVMVWAVSHDTVDGKYATGLADAVNRAPFKLPGSAYITVATAMTMSDQDNYCRWTNCNEDCPNGFGDIIRADSSAFDPDNTYMVSDSGCIKGTSHASRDVKKVRPKCERIPEGALVWDMLLPVALMWKRRPLTQSPLMDLAVCLPVTRGIEAYAVKAKNRPRHSRGHPTALDINSKGIIAEPFNVFDERTFGSGGNGRPLVQTALEGAVNGDLSLHYARWLWLRGIRSLRYFALEVAYWIGPQVGTAPSETIRNRYTTPGRSDERWIVFHIHFKSDAPNDIDAARNQRLNNGLTRQRMFDRIPGTSNSWGFYSGATYVRIYHGSTIQGFSNADPRVRYSDNAGVNQRFGVHDCDRSEERWYIGQPAPPGANAYALALAAWGQHLVQRQIANMASFTYIFPDTLGAANTQNNQMPHRQPRAVGDALYENFGPDGLLMFRFEDIRPLPPVHPTHPAQEDLLDDPYIP